MGPWCHWLHWYIHNVAKTVPGLICVLVSASPSPLHPPSIPTLLMLRVWMSPRELAVLGGLFAGSWWCLVGAWWLTLLGRLEPFFFPEWKGGSFS